MKFHNISFYCDDESDGDLICSATVDKTSGWPVTLTIEDAEKHGRIVIHMPIYQFQAFTDRLSEVRREVDKEIADGNT